MISVPFDTLRLHQRLIAAGFTEQQAAEALEIAREAATDVLATEADLPGTKADLREELRDFEVRMTMRVGWMLTAAVVILGVLKLAS